MDKEPEDRRLWIGNLDPRINEYQLLKLVQKYGKIEKFDLLFHRNGPLAGQPRGYAFVTYERAEDAVRAKVMHNKMVGCKNVIVTWAHSIPTDDPEKPAKPDVNIPVLAISSQPGKKTDRDFQIQAIEAKLKLMENQAGSLEINKIAAVEHPVISQYQYNKQQPTTVGGNSRQRSHQRNDRQGGRPYNKNRSRR